MFNIKNRLHNVFIWLASKFYTVPDEKEDYSEKEIPIDLSIARVTFDVCNDETVHISYDYVPECKEHLAQLIHLIGSGYMYSRMIQTIQEQSESDDANQLINMIAYHKTSEDGIRELFGKTTSDKSIPIVSPSEVFKNIGNNV